MTDSSSRTLLRVPRYDLDVELEWLSDLAPQSVATLQSLLPFAGLVARGRRYAGAVTLRLPHFPLPLIPENQTGFPVPGDVMLYQLDYGIELVLNHEGTWRPYDNRGYIAGNRVGVVANHISQEVAKTFRRFWFEGAGWGALGPAGTETVRSVRDDRQAVEAEIEARYQRWQRANWRDQRRPPAPARARLAKFAIPDYNVEANIQLLEEQAPVSVANLWRNLPSQNSMLHGSASGSEMFAHVNEDWGWVPELENKMAYPIPGDMVLYFGPPPRIQINYFYGRDSIPAGVPSPEIGNKVGVTVGDFTDLARACWRMIYDGQKTLLVDKVPS